MSSHSGARPAASDNKAARPAPAAVLGIFLVALRLGCTSFGGPIAHLGYFRQEYVVRRRWIDEESYADLVALCQFLPGPASSQVGMAIGMSRAGLAGGLAAWLGFTLPSAVLMVAVAAALHGTSALAARVVHGLLVLAVAVVAQAVWGMARRLAPDRSRGSIAIAAAVAALLWPSAATQVALIAMAGVLGWRALPPAARAISATGAMHAAPSSLQAVPQTVPATDGAAPPGSAAPTDHAAPPTGHVTPPGASRRAARRRRGGAVCLALFATLLVALPLLRRATNLQGVAMADSFYRAGALVFGGGHLILPLLQREVVPPGWVSNTRFLAGYGAAQAVPGPLSTFAAYLGAATRTPPNGIAGAALTTAAIFLPSFLLVAGVLPFWETLRHRDDIQAALRGINAAVVGILLAALYRPVWTSAIQAPGDAALALVAFGLLMLWALPPWAVVLVTVAGSLVVQAV